MPYYSIPQKIKSILDLIRFNKPNGFLLLMWPCWLALASLAENQMKYFKWYILFFIGSFLMRSAGCIINDIIDIKIDKKINRTSKRPLVTKSVKISEAIILLIALLVLSLLILLQFKLNSIFVGLLSIPLIIIYPYMKRYTSWPQLVLGIIFNWGIIIVSIEFYGYLSYHLILLYLGCIFWTLGYDTIYAYQDREDDIKNNIKSTAVLFGNNGKQFVLLFYIFFLSIIGYVSFDRSNTTVGIAILFLFSLAILFFLNKWDINSSKSSNKYFKFNNIIGIFCFIYLIIF